MVRGKSTSKSSAVPSSTTTNTSSSGENADPIAGSSRGATAASSTSLWDTPYTPPDLPEGSPWSAPRHSAWPNEAQGASNWTTHHAPTEAHAWQPHDATWPPPTDANPVQQQQPQDGYQPPNHQESHPSTSEDQVPID